MKRTQLFPVLIIFLAVINSYAQEVPETKHITLPNGWGISCVGESFRLGDLPLNIAVSNSGRLIAVTNNGQSDQSIYLIDAMARKVLDTIVIKEAWLGLAFSKDEKTLYVSGGNQNLIYKYSIKNNRLALADSLVLGKPWPNRISPSGMALNEKKNLLYVVTKENNSLYILDMTKKQANIRFSLEGEGYSCTLSGDSRSLYISCWGCGKVQVFNTETRKFVTSIKVGSNPNDLCLSKNGKYLYVANANDNSVSCIDVTAGRVIETLNSALYPDSPAGSTTNSVALSADNKTLYIANADNNCLAVFDVSTPGKSFSKGFIPTGWYPCCVRVVNKQVWVANGKGFTSAANPGGPNPAVKAQKVQTQQGDSRKPPKASISQDCSGEP